MYFYVCISCFYQDNGAACVLVIDLVLHPSCTVDIPAACCLSLWR